MFVHFGKNFTWVTVFMLVTAIPSRSGELSKFVYIQQVKASNLQNGSSISNTVTDRPVGKTRAQTAGNGDFISVSRTGLTNLTAAQQQGTANIGLIQQFGNRNAATLAQTGTGNFGLISQQGNGNTAILLQR